MNDVQCLIDRQLGLCSNLKYDNVLRRLVVSSEECYYGLQSGPAAEAGLETDPPIFACRFAEAPGYEHILALANEDGRVAIQDTSRVGGGLESFQCHNNAVFDLAWLPEQMSFVTASGDHTACVWDVTPSGVSAVVTLAGHSRSVKTAACGGGALLATGARDGHIKLWDTRQPRAAATLAPYQGLEHAHAASAPRTPGSRRTPPRAARAASVTALAHLDALTLCSAGEGDGYIKVWDLRKNYSAHRRSPLPRHAIPYAGSSTRCGYTSLVAAPPRLYASCMDHVIYCFNVAASEPRADMRYSGHESGSFYIRAALSDDGRYLVSGSSDACAYVWAVRRARPLLRLAAHRAEVTCAALPRRRAAAAPLLVTAGDDARHKLWRVGPERADRRRLRGHAEPLPAEPAPRRDHTPPPARPARPARPAPRSKRCLAQLLAAAPPAKRARRDLAAPAAPRERVAADPGTPPKRARADASPPDWGYLPQPGSSFMTPTKLYEKRSRVSLSPRSPGSSSPKKINVVRVSPTKVRIISFSPPTKDLPDFVRDGSAPHHRLMSPRKRRDSADWLTRLRRALPAPAPHAAPAPAAAAAPTAARDPPPPTRRCSTSDRTPKRKQTRTLLNYFAIKTNEQ